MRWPTGTLPVKRIASTPGCVTRCSATGTAPCTTLKTPGGKPAASKHFAISTAVPGPLSDGLKTTVFPISSAGTICPLGRCPGKLNGPTTATTPCGLWRISPGRSSTR